MREYGMRNFATLILAGALVAGPTCAQPLVLPGQAPTQPAAQVQPVAQVPARGGLTAGHVLALGAGMFGGAVLGSALIHGGSFAAAIGAVSGLATGHWYYIHHRNELD